LAKKGKKLPCTFYKKEICIKSGRYCPEGINCRRKCKAVSFCKYAGSAECCPMRVPGAPFGLVKMPVADEVQNE